MTLQQFADACNLNSLQEAEKVCHFAFFYFKTQNTQEFSVADAARWLKSYGLPAPNTSRLDRKLKELRNVLIRSSSGFRLHVNYVTEMQTKYPALGEKSQEVIEHGTVLSDLDFRNTRGYIESLAKQINASYENNIFDGCAVLMRRLLEVLLISTYRHLSLEHFIKDLAGNYFMLDKIISNAKNNISIDLSRNSKGSLDRFQQLGNFSAHKLEYICRREYISPHIQEYRALIVELLHKSGIRT